MSYTASVITVSDLGSRGLRQDTSGPAVRAMLEDAALSASDERTRAAVVRLGSNRIQKCDVRIIAATNRNLREMVEEKAFRADLYYRLNVLTIHVPPLLERVADIAPLTRYFVQLFIKKYGFTKHLMPALIRALEQWSWPGNVRELRNTVERILT